MKRISSWAHANKIPARAILVFLFTLLNLTGLFLGDILYSLNIRFTPLFYQVAIVLTLFGYFIYPFWKRKHVYKHLFVRQKSADLILVSATILFLVYAGNALNSSQNTYGNPGQAASILHISNVAGKSETPAVDKPTSKISLRKKILKEIKHLRKSYKESSDAQKKLYIVLAIFGAILLGLGITALACNISCSGSEALGAVLFFVGIAGVIFFVTRLIKRIKTGSPRRKKARQNA